MTRPQFDGSFSLFPLSEIIQSTDSNRKVKRLLETFNCTIKSKMYIMDYTRGNASIVLDLAATQLGTALANAKRLFDEAERNGTDNPKTEIHILVEYL